jgi:hypothetical protein
MKKILIVVAILCFGFITNSSAQGRPGNPPSSEEILKRTMKELTKKIDFTEDEELSIKEIFTEFFENMDEMHKSGSRPDRTKMDELVNKRDEKVKIILSDEKYKKYSKIMEKHKKGPQGNPPPRD